MFNTNFFEELINRYFSTKTAFAKRHGITVSSVNDWIDRGTIPQNRLKDVLNSLNISNPDELERFYNIPQIQTCFRASKAGQEKAINKEIKERAQFVAKIFLNIHDTKPTSNLLDTLRSNLKGKTDPEEIAQIIRSHFDLTDRSPFVIDQMYFFLQGCGVNKFYLPFQNLGLIPSEGVKPLAFTSYRSGEFLVICDSDRTLDEMNFDSTHELVHILTGNLSEDDIKTEKWVDSITEQLIYPKPFLLKEFPFLKQDKVIKIKDFDQKKLMSLFLNYSSMSPRGFAKALASYGYITPDLDVYKWLHDKYINPNPTGSKIGRMDFDFKDSFALEQFYSEVVDREHKRFPLFADLRQALVDERVTPRTFAQLFQMDSGDADELRKVWKKKLITVQPS